MLGFRYFAIAAAFVILGSFFVQSGDERASGRMVEILSKVQIECRKHSFEVANVRFGCQSFADVRKIEMRADNRNRGNGGERLIQIGR